ncbi:MAG: copper-binding protein [Candidatus Acidiferrales bacterium]
MRTTPRPLSWLVINLSIVLLASAFAGCGTKSQQAEVATGVKKYQLKGTIVSVDLTQKTADIDTEPIPGFMEGMTMDYDVHDTTALAKLKPKDKIAADLIADPNGAYLDHIVVVPSGSAAPPAKP